MGLDEDTACCYGIFVVISLIVFGFGYYMDATEYNTTDVIMGKEIVHDRYANDFYRLYTNVSIFDVDCEHYYGVGVGDLVVVGEDNVSSVRTLYLDGGYACSSVD